MAGSARAPARPALTAASIIIPGQRPGLEIAADLALGRIGRVGCDASQPQRRRVGPAIVIAVVAQAARDGRGTPRRAARSASAVFRVVSRLLPNCPPTIQAPGAASDAALCTASAIFGDAVARGETQLVEIGLAAHHDVVVDVDDPRHRHPPAEIDGRGALAYERCDHGLAADGNEPASLDSGAGRPGLLPVRRVDPTVAEDRVGECPVHTCQCLTWEKLPAAPHAGP